MPQKIQIGDKWYVAATAPRAEDQPQVLKHDQTFAMFDRFGDIQALAPGQEGLYHNDTRYLSYEELTINGVRPLYLGSSVEEANSLLVTDLMNPDLTEGGEVVLSKGIVHIIRSKLLWRHSCHEHIRLTHHGLETARITLAIAFEADYVDLFEVRGMKREQHGEKLESEVGADQVVLRYHGCDDLLRKTRIRFDTAPSRLDARQAAFDLSLAPGEEKHIYLTIGCECDHEPPREMLAFSSALNESNIARAAALPGRCSIETSNPLVNLWLERSVADLAMLTTALPTGPYPYAGVPWYSTTFGRDGILTALEYLWVNPELSRGVLCFLAQTQATALDPSNDAEPGKILHEARQSEMARTGEIPFGRYYGTVDATPLFLVLAAAYWRRTGDTALVRSIWPNILLALQWLERYGDADGDGFVEYARRSSDGLVQQGWKDSQDSVFHQSGELAEAPIALCEVQAYVYAAKRDISELAAHLGEAALATALAEQAQALQSKFQQDFWCEDIGSYAIALDGDKRQCRVRASNAGHALWCGIASPEHAGRIVDGLMGKAFFSGWGIRTVARGQPRYNPMAYHNGSIWPHDNALIAAGMARYGRGEDAIQLMAALFDASLHFEHHRLPELFCGFRRRPGAGPILYPVACSPQAWAAASVFAMLQACLGLDVRAGSGDITLQAPRLPGFIDWIRIHQLGAPERSADLLLQRYHSSVGIDVLRKDAGMRVTVAA